jgi:hypothetical protein
MEKKETIYANGFVGKKNEKDPEFVVARLYITKDDAIAFINKHANAEGWLSLEIKNSKTPGKLNVTLNTYQATNKKYDMDKGTKWESPF